MCFQLSYLARTPGLFDSARWAYRHDATPRTAPGVLLQSLQCIDEDALVRRASHNVPFPVCHILVDTASQSVTDWFEERHR